MSDDRVISSAADIDLSRHGVIEAHAGTGKTYTIVNLVLRMLEQADGGNSGKYIHLRKVLLVTFTEKAAGELKKRIREGIAARISELRAMPENDNLAAHLEDCQNNMHEAFIGTIHSVCLRLLQTWPFETGVHFNTEMVGDDSDGAEAALRTSMRTDWEDADSGLPRGLSAMENNGMMLERKHITLITQTALKIMSGAKLDTTPAGGLTLEEAVTQIGAVTKIDNAAEAETDAIRQKLLYAFINRAAEVLADRYEVYKREKGLVSYDDMLRLMNDAVNSENGVMLQQLRRRLRYGVIDEFQDTNPTQWSIFKKIFLGDGRDDDSSTDVSTGASTQYAKIYIVGDPKQSIYSFQGADINSYVAARNAIASLDGAVYSLVHNYRSLPETIDGYNAILCGGGNDDDWFLFDGADGISYPAGSSARPPQRQERPRFTLKHKAVQIVTLNAEKAPDRRRIMADATSTAIKKLIGTAVSIPNGGGWENMTLDYGDFAVIVETNDLAAPFIEEFRKRRIPCVKYKMKGIFKSAMARDLIALLSAIHKRHSRQRRTAALLTHFFNRPAWAIKPESDTDYCPNHGCFGDNLCVAHALDAWGKLADRQLWAQLFRSIVEKTTIRRKLIRLIDGERKLADLRQVTDYCIEYLYGQNSGLDRLIKHLELLYEKTEKTQDDKNIYTLATEKSSVKILTMHAAKGLEFPIVFLMNSDALSTSHNILLWTDEDKTRRITPYVKIDDLRKGKVDLEPLKRYKKDCERENRRLLYVAMTRPQAMLFVPMRECEKKGRIKECLTPRLNELTAYNDPNTEIFNGIAWEDSVNRTSADANDLPSVRFDDIPALSLQKFISVETSYSQISRQLKTTASKDNDLPELNTDDDGDDVTRNDEYHIEDVRIDTDLDTDVDINTHEKQRLIGGKTTGDALHKAIDELMRSDDVNAIINDAGGDLDNIVEKYLRRNGILDNKLTTDPTAAVKQASSYIKTALTLGYPAPDGTGVIILSALSKADRVSEMEFLLSCDPAKDDINLLFPAANRLTDTITAPYRIHGFIDLVFRLKDENCPNHPYRYYIVDWKSDTLERYDNGALRRYCVDRHYVLQAQIYTRALDKYLRGILGNRYDRERHLGGSLYVFLRGGAGIFL